MTGGNNVHGGHRERVKQRFLHENGFDNFEEHQILELLLFYAIPRKDTNSLAHRMLEEFGDLYTLINSEPEAIAQRTGVSINTAILVSLTGKLHNRCSPVKLNAKRLKNTEQVKKYFFDLMKDLTVERFYIVCLDENKRIIKLVKVAEGKNDSVELNINNVICNINQYRASYAVCAHNHPRGTQNFSIEDISTTMAIKQKLYEYGILLMDHILVCGDKAISMSETKKFKF